MALTLLLGGARSGKSMLAVQTLAKRRNPVSLIATARPDDDEMAERIEQHQRERPASWRLIEEPVDLTRAIQLVRPHDDLIIDCLTLWASNLMERQMSDLEIGARAEAAARAAASRSGDAIVVSNEVGSGIVPVNQLARRYRDVLGTVNFVWAAHATSVYLVVAGGVIPVDRLDSGLVTNE